MKRIKDRNGRLELGYDEMQRIWKVYFQSKMDAVKKVKRDGESGDSLVSFMQMTWLYVTSRRKT